MIVVSDWSSESVTALLERMGHDTVGMTVHHFAMHGMRHRQKQSGGWR